MSQRFSSIVILLLCLSVTGALTYIYSRMIEDDEQARFERVSNSVAEAVETRIRIYENALIAVRGLFVASENVSREEFRHFVSGFSLHERYPGFQRIGFATKKGDTFPILFMEPEDGELFYSEGFDMSSEPTRRATMERACDTGQPAASPKTTLAQSTGTSSQSGFLIFVPVYERGMPTETVSERRAALNGFVFSSFKSEDLFMRLSSEVQHKHPRVKISIYDGQSSHPSDLLFSSSELNDPEPRDFFRRESRHHTLLEIGVVGHVWTMAVTSTPGFELRSSSRPPLILFALGVVISFLIYFVLRFGDKLNEQLTKELDLKKRSEKEILKARKSAERANQAKSRFLANISHEIRTPLGVITGFTDLALEKLDPSHEVYSHLKTIRRNGQQLAMLIGEVLDLSKIEANKLDVEILKFSLPDLLDEIISSLDLTAREKGICLKWNKDFPIPEYISSDPTKLRQILVNLIGNSIKFTDRGEIQLTPRMLSPAEEGQPVKLEFIIKDTGIGIPEESKKELFHPFAQVDSSMTRKYGGTGLGLALSQQLARILCGDVVLEESEIGKGTTFSVRISGGTFEGLWNPEEFSKDDSTKVPQNASTYDSLTGTHVLLAEDSVDIQALVSLYLEDAGAEVDIANDGLEAVSKATTKDYDVILMDIQMPKLDGHEATTELRKNGCKKPIIALTAHAFKEERDRALSGGFNRYVTKPIARVALIDSVLEVTH